MAEKRKRSITQAGGLDISDVKKMGRAFIANLKKLSSEDLNKFPTSLLSGILRIVEPRMGTTALHTDKVAKLLKEKNKEGKVEKTYNSPQQMTKGPARKTGTATKKSSSAFMGGGMAKKKPAAKMMAGGMAKKRK